MAIYEFTCDECGKFFDVHQSIEIKGPHTAMCACGKEARRVFTPTGFRTDFHSGQDDGIGAYLDTKKDRERVMREKGLERIRD